MQAAKPNFPDLIKAAGTATGNRGLMGDLLLRLWPWRLLLEYPPDAKGMLAVCPMVAVAAIVTTRTCGSDANS